MAKKAIDTFPRQNARTQRFTLGDPRNIAVSPDGQRIIFARSRAGDDPLNCLWVLDVATASERLVGDPATLLAAPDDEDLPAEERLRRERMREGASGVTAFATDNAATVTAFALSGRLFLATRIAYVSGRALRIAELDGTSWELAAEDDPDITWGSADFIAAEEMHRFRGHWWSPDGSAIAACRVDTSAVQRWYIADPANPAQPPNEVRYPSAGTNNPNVTLHVLALDGGSTEVMWDRDGYPYLADVKWPTPDRLLLTVQSRDQRSLMVLEANPRLGDSSPLFADGDTAWVELVPGTPALLDDGTLITCADRDGARRLMVDGEPATPPNLQVRAVLTTQGDEVFLLANPIDDATVQHVWRWRTDRTLVALTTEPGIHSAAVGGSTMVLRSASITDAGVVSKVLEGGAANGSVV